MPPVAIAVAETSTNIAKHQPVTFNATGSYDPDGETITYEWDFNGDGIYGDSYDSGTDKHPTVIFHAGGAFDVDLRVTDSDQLSDTLDEKINVTVSNQPPTAYAEMSGQAPYYANANYTFDASGSEDVDGEISTCAWDFDYDGVTFNPDDYGEIIKHHFPLGEFSIMLCVYDDDGAFDYIDEPITRTFEYKENWPPEIDYVEQSRTTTLKNSYDERVTLTVHFSDPDPLDSHTFLWSCSEGQFNVTDQQTVEWTAPDKVGHFYITVRVTDLFGEWDEDSSTMIRVTKYPTGADPAGFNLSVPAPTWNLTEIPDQTMVKLQDYTPGNVVYINFWLST